MYKFREGDGKMWECCCYKYSIKKYVTGDKTKNAVYILCK